MGVFNINWLLIFLSKTEAYWINTFKRFPRYLIILMMAGLKDKIKGTLNNNYFLRPYYFLPKVY